MLADIPTRRVLPSIKAPRGCNPLVGKFPTHGSTPVNGVKVGLGKCNGVKLHYMPKAHLDYTGGPCNAGTIVVGTISVTRGNLSGPSTSKYFKQRLHGVWRIPAAELTYLLSVARKRTL